ncbi:hypothetical protein VNI00_016514 [Paramarasmius palmivorus]|uniref:Uncharacterized protein n=1 Tax=Paramarasmius palmivorus TaxID=297713 RepID=A0AAW0BDJ5_9AGAR
MTATELDLPALPKVVTCSTSWSVALLQLRCFLDRQRNETTVNEFARCPRNTSKWHPVKILMGKGSKEGSFGCLALYDWSCSHCKPKSKDYVVESLDAPLALELAKLYYWYLRQCPGNHKTRIGSLLEDFPDASTPSIYQSLLCVKSTPSAMSQTTLSSQQSSMANTFSGKGKQKAGKPHPLPSDRVLEPVPLKRKASDEPPIPISKRRNMARSASQVIIDISDDDESVKSSPKGTSMVSTSSNRSRPLKHFPLPSPLSSPVRNPMRADSPVEASSSKQVNEWTPEQLIAAMEEVKRRVRTGTHLQKLRGDISTLYAELQEAYRVGRLED